MFQGAEVSNAETGKQQTPPSTFNQSIDPIFEDNMIVDSSPPKDDEDPEKMLSEPPQDLNDKSVEDDQQHIDEENEGGPSLVESGKSKEPRGLNSEDDTKHTDTDGEGRKEYVKESKDESKQDSPKTKSPTRVTNSTSVTISQEEFDVLKERDPFEALDLMLVGNILPSNTDTESSTSAASELSENYKADLIEELRTRVLEVDLFQAIEQDESIIHGIKNVLHRLTNSSLDPKFIKFSVELEPILDQIVVDLHMKKDSQTKLADQNKCRDELMDEIEESKEKIYIFKREVPNVKKKVEEYDLAISEYEKAIQELKSNKKSLLEKDERLKKEANLTIRKVEDSKRKNAEIAKLKTEGDLLDAKLAHSKTNLNKLKTEFKI